MHQRRLFSRSSPSIADEESSTCSRSCASVPEGLPVSPCDSERPESPSEAVKPPQSDNFINCTTRYNCAPFSQCSGGSEGSVDSLVSASDASAHGQRKSRRKHKHDKKTSFKLPPPASPKHRKHHAKREALRTAEISDIVAEAVATRVAELLQFTRFVELVNTIRSESAQQLTDLSNSIHSLTSFLNPSVSSHCSRRSSLYSSQRSWSKDMEQILHPSKSNAKACTGLSSPSRESRAQKTGLPGVDERHHDRHLARMLSKGQDCCTATSTANMSIGGAASMSIVPVAAASEEKLWQVCGAGAAACAKKIQADQNLEQSKLQATAPGSLPMLLGSRGPEAKDSGLQPAHAATPADAHADVGSRCISTSAALHPRFSSEEMQRCPSPYQSDPGLPSSGLEKVEETTRSITTGNLPGELEDLIFAARRQSSDSMSSDADSLSSAESASNDVHLRVSEWSSPKTPLDLTPRTRSLPDRLPWPRKINQKTNFNSYRLTSGCQSLVSHGPRLLRRTSQLELPVSDRKHPSRTPTFENLYEVQRSQERMLLEADAKTQERRSGSRPEHQDRRSSGGRLEAERRAVCVPDKECNDVWFRSESPALEVVTEVKTVNNSVYPDHVGQRTQQRHTTGQSQCTSTHTPGDSAFSECPSYSLEALRRQRNTELSKIAFSHDAGSECLSSEEEEQQLQQAQAAQGRLRLVLKLTLRLWGVVPWYPRCLVSACYQITAVLAVTFITICPAVRLALSSSGPEEKLSAQMIVCIVPFALAGMVGLASMQNQLARELLWSYPGPLETYATQHGFMEQWAACSLRRFVWVFMVWASAVLLCALNWALSEADMLCGRRMDLTYFLCFFFGSGVFAALIFCQIHIFGMLEIMVDQFCIKFFEDPEVARGLVEWNLVQAILRRVATALDTCFLATQAMAQVAFVVSATYTVMADRLHNTSQMVDYSQDCHIGHRAVALLPSVLLAFGAWTLFFFGAAVTEKCSRVPAMINTMTFDDCQRQSMVQYVMNSAAGLYIKEVRLTASVVMKLSYVTGLWVLAVLTEFIGK